MFKPRTFGEQRTHQNQSCPFGQVKEASKNSTHKETAEYLEIPFSYGMQKEQTHKLFRLACLLFLFVIKVTYPTGK